MLVLNIYFMPNVYIETYGCSANQAESEIMAGLLTSAGINIVKNIKNADIVIINTCYVKFPTEQRIFSRIKKIDKKLIIAGCMPEAAYDKLIEIVPKASLISTHHITDIVKVIKRILKGKRVELIGRKKEIKLCLPRIRKNPVIDIVPIASGCTGDCSYCSVKFAKGELFSYPKEMIIKEIKNSLKQGCKEIWLTSQDNAAYGLDNGKQMLPELLRDISKIPGKFFVRVGMMNPDNVKSILSDLISSYNNKKIYKFLHLPVQSGDNDVLRKMNRKYKIQEFEEIIKEFENAFRIQLWTDVIVGFPGETDQQFRKTLELLKRVKPDWVNISKYGVRKYTAASKLKPLKSEIIKQRSKVVSNIVNILAFEKNKKWVNWKGDVLISKKGKKPGQWLGRNFAYKSVLINKRDKILGKFLKVKILEASPSYLLGWPLK